jgi:MoaA/NifB/PqqE/SkfB family radical SAM enzyme
MYRQGVFTVLDVELGGSCNMACIYCDTPERQADALLNLALVERLFATGDIRWLFICGLGEPTAAGNHAKLTDLLALCAKHGVQCSMFTNLFELTDDVKRALADGTLNILFKLDSFQHETVAHLYGIEETHQYLANIREIADYVRYDGQNTNIAASIVPTSHNTDELVEIVRYCVDANIAPMIGGLENAGKSTEVFAALRASDDKLIAAKHEVSQLIGRDYNVPVCPAVIGGMHISYDNNLQVDYYTGLSCHWFWMEAPRTQVLGSLDETWEPADMHRLVEEFRAERLDYVRSVVDGIVEQPFGGCGGDMGSLLRRYIVMQEEKRV